MLKVPHRYMETFGTMYPTLGYRLSIDTSPGVRRKPSRRGEKSAWKCRLSRGCVVLRRVQRHLFPLFSLQIWPPYCIAHNFCGVCCSRILRAQLSIAIQGNMYRICLCEARSPRTKWSDSVSKRVFVWHDNVAPGSFFRLCYCQQLLLLHMLSANILCRSLQGCVLYSMLYKICYVARSSLWKKNDPILLCVVTWYVVPPNIFVRFLNPFC